VAQRVAVVSGGTGGLGTAICVALAAQGCKVFAADIPGSAARDDAFRAATAGHEVAVAPLDVTDFDACAALVAGIEREHGRVDILVNAAGGNVQRARTDGVPPFGLPLDAFDEVVRLNLHGSVYPSLVFGEAMARQGTGCIINISSMASTQALSGVMGYSVAKAAIDNFTKWLAVDLARKCGPGLRVNAIAPGYSETQLAIDHWNTFPDPEAERRRVCALHPPKRIGKPEEVAMTALFLASDEAPFINAETIVIDGGRSVLYHD